MDIQALIRKHALANAIKYDGKANQGAVIGKILSEAPELKKDMKAAAQMVAKILYDISSLSVEEQRAELERDAPELLEKKKPQERTLPELKNAVQGKVVVRLAPYPSGPLHIGNARPAILNDEYAKRYEGKMLLVLDDTIGSDEKQIAPEAYDLIPQGLSLLDVKWSGHIIYKSDRLDIYYDVAKKLIDTGYAYVCTCPFAELRANREKALDCEHRSAPISQTSELWKKMIDGFFAEGEAVLRIKTSMQHPNPAFRDRVLFRISSRAHPRVGTKYHVWPLLEFSWAVDDNLLGVTHVIRGKDLLIETDMERFIWNVLGWPDREVLHIGLLQIEGVKISKSKSSQEVTSGAYTGWDDPRTWSLQSLHRRGILPAAIRHFVLSFGVNSNEIKVPVDNLYAENRKLLEPETLRYFFVCDPVEIRVDHAPHHVTQLRKHPNDSTHGFRELISNGQFYIAKEDMHAIKLGDFVRLMDCINFTKQDSGFVFHSKEIEQYRAHGKKILHWLPVSEDLAPAKVLLPDGTWLTGLCEASVRTLSHGTIIQFERFGFCRFDHEEDGTFVFWFAHK